MKKMVISILLSSTIAFSQNSITIDGNFDDWLNVPLAAKDSADNVHDTDGYNQGGQPAEFLIFRC